MMTQTCRQNLSSSGPRSKTCLRFIPAMLIAVCLFSACSPATKYVIVTDYRDVNFGDGDRFYFCLLAHDAKRIKGMLGLQTAADVGKYEQTRTELGDPLEQVLFELIKSNYHSARSWLDRGGEELPLYVRLLLKADLSYETDGKMPAAQLVQMYQDAYENQACDLNKDLIKMRIRQVRYRR